MLTLTVPNVYDISLKSFYTQIQITILSRGQYTEIVRIENIYSKLSVIQEFLLEGEFILFDFYYSNLNNFISVQNITLVTRKESFNSSNKLQQRGSVIRKSRNPDNMFC